MSGAPAGPGAREAIMLAVLSSLCGAAVAIGLSVAARLVSTMGDLLALLSAIRYPLSFNWRSGSAAIGGKLR